MSITCFKGERYLRLSRFSVFDVKCILDHFYALEGHFLWIRYTSWLYLLDKTEEEVELGLLLLACIKNFTRPFLSRKLQKSHFSCCWMQVQQVFSNEKLVLHFWGNLIIFNFHRLIFGLFKKKFAACTLFQIITFGPKTKKRVIFKEKQCCLFWIFDDLFQCVLEGSQKLSLCFFWLKFEARERELP